MYKKSNVFFKCMNMSVWPWYIHASRYPEQIKMTTTLMRSIIGVNADDDVHYSSVVMCRCSGDIEKTIYHVLFECVNLQTERCALWSGVANVAPAPLLKSISELNIYEKTHLFVNGFNSKYIPELSEVYTAVLTYMFILLCKSTL